MCGRYRDGSRSVESNVSDVDVGKIQYSDEYSCWEV